MAAEGTGAAIVAAATVAMTPTDNSGNNRGGQQWRQVETEAALGADNNQPESGAIVVAETAFVVATEMVAVAAEATAAMVALTATKAVQTAAKVVEDAAVAEDYT